MNPGHLNPEPTNNPKNLGCPKLLSIHDELLRLHTPVKNAQSSFSHNFPVFRIRIQLNPDPDKNLDPDPEDIESGSKLFFNTHLKKI